MSEDLKKPPVPHCDKNTDCHIAVYTPGGVIAFFLYAYRIVAGTVVEYIPRNSKTGESDDSIHIIIGTIEIIHGTGHEYNVEAFAELRERIAKKNEYDQQWEAANAIV